MSFDSGGPLATGHSDAWIGSHNVFTSNENRSFVFSPWHYFEVLNIKSGIYFNIQVCRVYSRTTTRYLGRTLNRALVCSMVDATMTSKYYRTIRVARSFVRRIGTWSPKKNCKIHGGGCRHRSLVGYRHPGGEATLTCIRCRRYWGLLPFVEFHSSLVVAHYCSCVVAV